MSKSEVHFVEDCGNDWHKYYDTRMDCFFYFNRLTQETSWTKPKKICSGDEIELLPIDHFINEEDTTALTTSDRSRCQSETINEKCLKCGTLDDVLGHQYCKTCYDEINSPEAPLIRKFKIRCKKCYGWGLGLVQADGCCRRCSLMPTTLLPSRIPSIWDDTPRYSFKTPENTCLRCGGWGKDLIKENGKCAYCLQEEARVEFERRWKKRCYLCKGFGLDLVQENGLCRHCERIVLSASKNLVADISLSQNSTLNPKEFAFENQYLQKRKLDLSPTFLTQSLQ